LQYATEQPLACRWQVNQSAATQLRRGQAIRFVYPAFDGSLTFIDGRCEGRNVNIVVKDIDRGHRHLQKG
jgi:hypothetical protein